MTGSNRDPVHEHVAEAREDARREIVAAGRTSGIDDHDVVGGDGLRDGSFEQGRIVGDAWIAHRDSAIAPHGSCQQNAVGIDDRTARGAGDRGVDQFIAGGDDRHAREPNDRDVDDAARGDRREIRRAQPPPFGDDGFGGDDVFADRPHVRPGRDRGANRNGAAGARFEVLDHDDGVGMRRQRIAGVHHKRVGVEPQHDRHRFGRPVRRRRGDGDAVHRARMIVRRRQAGEDRSRRHPVERLVEGDVLDAVVADAGGVERRVPARPRLFERNVGQERCVAEACVAHGTMTRTTVPAAKPLWSSGTTMSPSECTSVKMRFDLPKIGVASSWPEAPAASVHGT